MLNSKKITKLGGNLSSPSSQSSHHKASQKITKSSRCRFKQIPQNSKFSLLNPLFPLSGDFTLLQFQDAFATDISLFNESKTYRHITVTTVSDERQIITIRPNPRTDQVLPSHHEILEHLAKSDNPELTQWTSIIKTFYQKYDKVMKRQSHKKTKCDVRKKFYIQVTSNTDQKKKEIFEKYPCVELNFRLKNHQSQLSEIIFDDRFIKEIGYSNDVFITTVLNEGIPQLMTYDSFSLTAGIKTLIENYFQIQDTGFEGPESEAILIMKNGYVKKIRYQMHVMMNYETNTFGMDVILAIISKDEPYLRMEGEESAVKILNEDFVQEMAMRESEANYFLSEFYDQVVEKRYTNINNICNIKEINSNI